jgi:hypothetical protein
MKIVVNSGRWGFGLSEDARKAFAERKGLVSVDSIYDSELVRDDPDLIAVIEELGCDAAGRDNSQLEIVEIPDDVEWQIGEYDGDEWVAEVHRTWGSAAKRYQT